MDCFWFDILKSVSSGLCTGLILAFIGWRVWKVQHNYTKKFDVYIKSLANISQIKWLIDYIRNPIRQVPVEDIYQQNKELFDLLERHKFEFGIYFGIGYYKDFESFSNTMFILRTYDYYKVKEIYNTIDPVEFSNTLYGVNKDEKDEIADSLEESFQHIENALKNKKSEKK